MSILTVLLDDEYALHVNTSARFWACPSSTRVRNFFSAETLREKPFFAEDEEGVALFRGDNIVFLENVNDDCDWGTTLRVWNWKRDLERHVDVPSWMGSVHTNSTEIATVDNENVHFWSAKLRHQRYFSTHDGIFAGLTEKFYGITRGSATILHDNQTGQPTFKIENVSVLALSKTACCASFTLYNNSLSIEKHDRTPMFKEKVSLRYRVESARFSNDGTVLVVQMENGDSIRLCVYISRETIGEDPHWAKAETFDFDAKCVRESGEVLKQNLDISISPSGAWLLIQKFYRVRGDVHTYFKNIKKETALEPVNSCIKLS